MKKKQLDATADIKTEISFIERYVIPYILWQLAQARARLAELKAKTKNGSDQPPN